jgi:DMSO reductase anchor subunit
LGASTLHLGRPIYAWRALRGLRRSWLSREVLAMAAFATTASVYAIMLFFGAPGRDAVGSATVVCGAIGVLCSARIYMVRARPAWNSLYTVAEFLASAFFLGPLFVRAMNVSPARWAVWTAVAGGMAQLFLQTLKYLWLSQSDSFELRASARLLSGRMRGFFILRLAALVAAGIILPLASEARITTLTLALGGECLGRWLFFVSVVPKNVAAAFGAPGRRAA